MCETGFDGREYLLVPATSDGDVSSVQYIICVVCRVRVCRVPFSSLPATISTCISLISCLLSFICASFKGIRIRPCLQGSCQSVVRCESVCCCFSPRHSGGPIPSIFASRPLILRLSIPSLQHRSTVVCEVPTPLQMSCSFNWRAHNYALAITNARADLILLRISLALAYPFLLLFFPASLSSFWGFFGDVHVFFIGWQVVPFAVVRRQPWNVCL